MSEPKPQRLRQRDVLIALVAGMMCGGCQFYADPRSDDLADQPAVTTPSVEAARAAPADRVPRKRPFAPMHTSAKDGTVMHAALLFEDGAEDSADGDQRFAWSNEDLAQWFLGPARFLVNIGLFPINPASRLTEPGTRRAGPRRHFLAIKPPPPRREAGRKVAVAHEGP